MLVLVQFSEQFPCLIRELDVDGFAAVYQRDQAGHGELVQRIRNIGERLPFSRFQWRFGEASAISLALELNNGFSNAQIVQRLARDQIDDLFRELQTEDARVLSARM